MRYPLVTLVSRAWVYLGLHSLLLAAPLLTLPLLSLSSLATAESILQVLPTRVVMAGAKRSVTVTLINRGDEDGNYRMFFRNIRANENGEFSEIQEPQAGELFADNMVRFSPRRIMVPARSKQSIRVLLRKPADLDNGEYRSHLVFRKLPVQNSLLDQASSENAVGFSLRPIVEVTIPIIVRHGETEATMTLSDATLVKPNEFEESIKFTINREGNRSLYGDVDVWWVNNDGQKQNIAMARGIAVYTPNDKRVFSLQLDMVGKNASDGKLLLEFNEDPAYGGNLKAQLEKPI